MTDKQEMKNLIPALIKARLAFKSIAKDRTNPHYKTKYATLDSVLDAVTEPLAANGLAIVQTVNPVAEQPILTTHLYHESGESIESNYPLPAIADPQKLGAAITYARRYALCAILSVTADEDDDGNSNRNSEGGPTVVAKKSISTNVDRLRSVTTALGMNKEVGDRRIKDAIAAEFPGKKSSDLDAAGITRVIDNLLIEFGANSLGDAAKSVKLYSKVCDSSNLIQDWLTLLEAETLQSA